MHAGLVRRTRTCTRMHTRRVLRHKHQRSTLHQTLTHIHTYNKGQRGCLLLKARTRPVLTHASSPTTLPTFAARSHGRTLLVRHNAPTLCDTLASRPSPLSTLLISGFFSASLPLLPSSPLNSLDGPAPCLPSY